jgi:hypothetical protein
MLFTIINFVRKNNVTHPTDVTHRYFIMYNVFCNNVLLCYHECYIILGCILAKSAITKKLIQILSVVCLSFRRKIMRYMNDNQLKNINWNYIHTCQ